MLGSPVFSGGTRLHGLGTNPEGEDVGERPECGKAKPSQSI